MTGVNGGLRSAQLLRQSIVLSNVMITIRIPSVVEQVGHGTAQTAGIILAAMQFVRDLGRFSLALDPALPRSLVTRFGVALWCGPTVDRALSNLLMLALVTMLAGFAYSVALTTVYNVLSDKMPAGVLTRQRPWRFWDVVQVRSQRPLSLVYWGLISSAPAFIFWIFWYPHDPDFLFWPLDCAKEREVHHAAR